MKVFYDKDCELSLIKGKTVAIIGYGSQGHAHALNLHESCVKFVVGLRKGGASWSKAENAGLKVQEVAEAVKAADLVMMLLPDENIAEVYRNQVAGNIKAGFGSVFRSPGGVRHADTSSHHHRPRSRAHAAGGGHGPVFQRLVGEQQADRKSTRLNSSH